MTTLVTSVTMPRMRGTSSETGSGSVPTAPRRPRPVLSEEKILGVALEMAESDGISKMTMRAIGERRGADPTAVYRYFPKKADLLEAMADRLFAEVPLGDRDAPWRDRIENMTTAARKLYRDHPSLTTLLATSDDTLDSLVTINEHLLVALLDAGLPPEEAAVFHQAIISSVLGAAILDSNGAFTDDDERATLRRVYSALPPEQYPALAANAAHLFPEADDVFDLTLQLTLDAIENAANRHSHHVRPTPESTT